MFNNNPTPEPPSTDPTHKYLHIQDSSTQNSSTKPSPTDPTPKDQDPTTKDPFPQQKTWQNIILTKEDRDDILKGKWLNDHVINVAQLLLKHDEGLLPVGSLQDTLLIQERQGDMVCYECSDSPQWWESLDHHQYSRSKYKATYCQDL